MSGEYARRGIGLKGPVTGLVLVAIVVYGAYWGWNSAFGDTPTTTPTAICPTVTTTLPTGTTGATGTGAITQPGPSAPGAATVSGTPVLIPQAVTVNVYNATSRRGLAADTAAALRTSGFLIGEVGNEPQVIEGAAEIRASRADDPQVKLLIQFFPDASVVADGRTDSTVDVIVGEQFSSLTTPTAITPVFLPTSADC